MFMLLFYNFKKQSFYPKCKIREGLPVQRVTTLNSDLEKNSPDPGAGLGRRLGLSVECKHPRETTLLQGARTRLSQGHWDAADPSENAAGVLCGALGHVSPPMSTSA